jgi:gliding motility-associated-like protein
MENDSFEHWYIAFNGVQAGMHMGMLLSINPVTGLLQWSNQYGDAAANQQFIFKGLAVANLRPRVAGVFSTGNGAYTLGKVTVNVSSGTEHIQVYQVPSVSFDTTARVAIDAQAQVLAFEANKNDPDIYAIKTAPEAAADTAWNWAKKFTVAGSHHFVHTQQTFDAGLMITTDLPEAAGTTRVQVLKTDSTGALTNCEGADFGFSNQQVAQTSVPYPAAAVNVLAALVAENPQVGTGMLPADFSCKTLTCPVQASEDSCLTSFVRRFKSTGFCDLGIDLLPQSNEVIFSGGMRNNAVDANDQEAILGRLDSRGKLLERKKIKLGNISGFNKMLQLKDGNFIVLGSSTYNLGNSVYDAGFITVSKFTPSLQLLWSRAYNTLGIYSLPTGIVEDGDGSLFLKYTVGPNPFCMKVGIMKLDGQGNLLWLKEYEAAGKCVIGNSGSVIQDDQYLYLVNWTNGAGSNLFMKVDKTTGLPVLARELLMPDAYQWRDADIAMLGENIVLHAQMSFLNGNSRNTLLLIDKSGVVLKNNCFSYQNYGLALAMLISRNHEIVLSGDIWGYSCFLRLDSNLNILYSKKTVSAGIAARAIREDASGAMLAIGFFYSEDPYKVDLMYKKFTYDGNVGSCFTDSLMVDTESHAVSSTALTPNVSTGTLNLEILPYSETSYSLQNAQLMCAQVSGCSAIHLQAPASLCDTLVHVAKVSRNAGCTLPVSFTQSNANLKIVSSTDSTVSFKMLQSGSTKLVAAIFTGCNWLRDSVVINSTIGGDPVGLGGDTSICPSNSIVLRAGKNYFSYLWNDGSTADTLKVIKPGNYFVAVTDACANIQADTIVVKAAPPVAISIGPDKIKCNDDRVLLAAPAGFISYSWGPAYNLIPVSDSQVNVFPLKDTSYFIRAEKTPGCFAFDTVFIKVNRSAAIQLGADRSFCSGDSILLDAGAGFTSYTWSTGAVSQKIIASVKGMYTVSATNLLGCVSKDTLLVMDVFATPVVQLGNDFSLCRGNNKTLDAGAFSTYLWNNLSTGRTLLVNNTGLYSVKVTDQNNCIGRDTVAVISILALPANFLPADTLLCQYETIQLTARSNFSSYAWSTGSVDKIIPAKAPGIYWLQVKDANNCIGTDSIAIGLKPCMAGFYIPTAFTPNNDGKNDLFKPVLLGNVLQYRFLIYNRYGQLIFESTDPTKGWNGKVNDRDQNSNGFTWVCQYQLEGSSSKTEKGSVVLLR